MKFLKGITIPSIPTALLSTDSSGNVGAADITDIVSLLPVETSGAGGRLTLASGVPLTVTDISDVSTIYYTPYSGDTLTLWNTASSQWDIIPFTEKSFSTSSLTASKVYDVFAVNGNNQTFTLSTTVWTNYTTRATGLAWQNGVLTKSGSPGSRYLGSFVLDASKNTQDNLSQRWVWNHSNRVARKFFSSDSNSTGYTLVGGAGVIQYCRATASTSQVSILIGQPREPIQITACNYAFIPAGASMCPGINVSTFGSPTTIFFVDYGFSAGNSTATLQSGAMMSYSHQPTAGGDLFLLTQLEFAIAGTITFYPGLASNNFRMGLSGIYWG